MASIEELKHIQIPLKDISLATNNFAEENLIAVGGFGRVYHGKSEEHGLIAIKRLIRSHTAHGQGNREFMMEIALLSVYKHENIVSLLGFCDEGGEKILVYKLESNGSLEKHLGNKDLDWAQRLRICIDAAHGLKYLHDDVGPQHRILHRDVKSSNILLDENWKAKISDFGLSKIGPANVQHTFLISYACGTIGYIDPEYINDGILTQKSDVYSFGVVLFEVLCGRPAHFVKPGEKHQLFAKLVKHHHKEGTLDQFIDSSMRKEMVSNSLKIFSFIACQCLDDARENRPLMNFVLEQLETALYHQVASRDEDSVTYPHTDIGSLRRVPSLNSVVDENLVGMGTRLQDLQSRLRIGSGDVRMVGIWGIGGGGKTTLAFSLYMKMKISGHFDGCCFVENIREESRQQNGLKNMQERILSTIFDKRIQLESVELGKDTIKQMLCRRNVLIVLDDVDELDQLEALAGRHNWFGEGSRIVITTRDQHVLIYHRVDEIYPVSLLSHDEALRLFKRHAYSESNPVEDYETLSKRVVSYAAGLPLALNILGSFLYGKNRDEWLHVLDRLSSKIPDSLRISFDALNPVEKELFLDIACFFKEEKENKAMEVLDACGFHPRIGIKVLIQKALITISSDGEFDMHNLVQEMGHRIVRGKHLDNPAEHSRIWKTTDIDYMCSENATMTNDRVEAIKYDGRSLRFPELVSNMKKLRFLCASNSKFRDVTKFCEAPSFLSNELRYIHLSGYLASPLPEDFRPSNLVVLKLDNSLHKELWKDSKYLPWLKELYLTNASDLVTTPDFGGFPRLQKFMLQSCKSLENIHPSLGNHSSLVYVSIHQCQKLSMFPTIVRMEKLKILEIWYCEALLEFPEIQAHMDRLENLSLINAGIEVLPSSIGKHCTNLISLKLEGCQQLKSIEGNFHSIKHLKKFELTGLTQLETLPEDLFDECRLEEFRLLRMRQPLVTFLPRNLRKLCLSWCSLNDGDIPSDICQLSNLQELDLSENTFSQLPVSILQLSQLKFLNLTACYSLVTLPELPSSISILTADECNSLEVDKDIREDCVWLSQISLRKVSSVTIGERLLQSMLQGKAIESSMSLQLHGLEIPNTFDPCLCKGTTCTLLLPYNWYYDYCGFLMCAAVGENYNSGQYITMKHEKDSMMGMNSESGVWKASSTSGLATWVGYVSFGSLKDTKWWDSTSDAIWFSIDFSYAIPYEDRCYNAGFGVKLVSKKSKSGTMEKTDSSELSDDEKDYTHKFKIKDDSKSALKIVF